MGSVMGWERSGARRHLELEVTGRIRKSHALTGMAMSRREILSSDDRSFSLFLNLTLLLLPSTSLTAGNRKGTRGKYA